MVRKSGLESWAEEPTVIGGFRFQITGISGIQMQEPRRGRGVESVCIVAPDQVLDLCESTNALPGEEHVQDVRAADPLQQAALVELALPRSLIGGSANAEDSDGLNRLAEHADRFDHPYHRRVVRPHPAVHQPNMILRQ